MGTISYILQKEFLQIRRNKMIIVMIILMPIIQLIILGNAADYEMKHINLHVMDRDLSTTSRTLVSKFRASSYFSIVNSSFDAKVAERDIRNDAADLIMEIPHGLERDLMRGEQAPISLRVNAINGVKGGLANAYTTQIIQDFNGEWLSDRYSGRAVVLPVGIAWSNWFNPGMNYATFMVPGILVLLITIVGVFLSGINIVREKEMGTIEQINVTPIKKSQFIVGKLFPFLVIALIELTLGLGIGRVIFGIHYVGNVGLIYLFSIVYLIAILGLGLLVSTITETQQQAMFIAWFILMVFILMSGLFTPIESMPRWAQIITDFNPIKYFVEVMRMVLLKGSGISDISRHFGIMALFGLVTNTLAVWNYRKRV